MHITIPYTFTANVVPPRKIKELRTIQGAFLTVEIPDVDELEAPIATAWTNIKDENLQTRWYDGSHWMAYNGSDYDGNKFPLTTNLLIDMLRNGESGTSLTVGHETTLKKLCSGEMKAFDKEDFRSVGENDQEAVISRILQTVNDSVIIEGQMWRRCGEPYYRYKRGNYIDEGNIVYPDIEFAKPGKKIDRARDAYSADQFDGFAARYTVNSQFRSIEVSDDFKISILIPESIQLDVESEALHDPIETYITMTAGRIGRETPHFIRLWADLKEALELATAHQSDYDIQDNLVKSAKQLAEILPESYYEKNIVVEAIKRWESRPISLSLETFKL